MSIVRKKGRTIRSAERNLISHIIKCCEYEAYQNELFKPLKKYIDRAAIYCCTSPATIYNIKKEVENNEGSTSNKNSPSTPGKNRPVPEYRSAIANLNRIDRRVIIEILEDFYINKKIVLTCSKLLPVLKDRINFNWKFSTLRKLLRLMGFKWKQCKSRRILVERQDIVNKRFNYLQMLKSFKDKELPIFYLDETWVDNNLTFKKYWQNEEFAVNKKAGTVSNRIMILHIGSKTGFLDGCELLLETGTAKSDQIDSESFERWIKETVIPKLPSPSVIVMDNARYHNRIVNNPPNISSMKKDMIEYLQNMGVMCDGTMRKCTLYDLILSVQPQEKTYEVDNLLESYGHKVLRLPPYMHEFNPIELAWVKLESFIYENKKSGSLSMQFIRYLVEKGLHEIKSGDWAVWCKHVETLENKYWSMDGKMEDAVDKLIIELGGFGDNCETENDSDYDRYVEEDATDSSGEETADDSCMEGTAAFQEAAAINSRQQMPVRAPRKETPPIIIKFVSRTGSHTILEGQKVVENPSTRHTALEGDATSQDGRDHDYMRSETSVKGASGHGKELTEYTMPRLHFLDDSLQNCSTGSDAKKNKEFESPLSEPKRKMLRKDSSPTTRELDYVDKLFLSYAETFKTFKPVTQGEFKIEMVKLLARMKIKDSSSGCIKLT